jgi:hypothetical protein
LSGATARPSPEGWQANRESVVWPHDPPPPSCRAIVAVALARPAAGPNESWPQFRGASAGVAENDPALPDSWSATSNIAWTADVPGMG